MKGRCGHNESELQVSWVDGAYTLKLLFVKVTVTKGLTEKGYRLRENMDSGHPSVGFLEALKGFDVLFLLSFLAGQESHNTSKGPEGTLKN